MPESQADRQPGDQRSAAPDPEDELTQLLEELRVMLPGIEVVFAFLLTVPFSERFTEISQLQELTYYIAVFASAVATILLIAPSAIHRIERHPSKARLKRLLRVTTMIALGGTVVMAVALTAVIFLITDILYQSTWAAIGAGAIAGFSVGLWFILPLVGREPPATDLPNN